MPNIPTRISAEYDYATFCLYALLMGRKAIAPPMAERGAIDLPLLLDFCAWTRQKDTKMRWIRVIVVCGGTGLRTSQMNLLQRKHFNRVGARWTVTVEKIKDPNRRAAGRPAATIKIPVHEAAAGVLDFLLRDLSPDDHIAPFWLPATVNALVQDAARSLGWDPTLTWSGAHCLRHGVATALSVDTSLEAAQATLGHATPQMTMHYARTNTVRKASAESRQVKVTARQRRVSDPKRAAAAGAGKKKKKKK
jgi:integrase